MVRSVISSLVLRCGGDPLVIEASWQGQRPVARNARNVKLALNSNVGGTEHRCGQSRAGEWTGFQRPGRPCQERGRFDSAGNAPVMALPLFLMWNPWGRNPEWYLTRGRRIQGTVRAPAASNAAAALIPDAAAAGAAMAVTITGTVQATPLTTLRRLNPPFPSLLVISSFMTSDNCAPTLFLAGASPFGPAEDFAALSPASPTLPNGPKGSHKRSERFAQDFLKFQWSAFRGADGSVSGAASSRARRTLSKA